MKKRQNLTGNIAENDPIPKDGEIPIPPADSPAERRKRGLAVRKQVFQAIPPGRALLPEVFMPKMPRNEPCYCGSGLKHKKCCAGLIRGEKVEKQ